VTSLVLPAYNPGPQIERTYLAVRNFLRRRRSRWEAVFVLDGCTDGTDERLSALRRRASEPRIQVLAFAENRGKGHALRAGLLAARGSRRIFTDVDLAYGFRDILRVNSALRRGAHVAIASRDHHQSELRLPARMLPYALWRRAQSRCFGAVVRTLLPIAQRDTQAGLKGMQAAVAESVLPQLHCDGFGFDCELLTACARLRIDVAEVPVAVRFDDRRSTTNWRSTTSMIGEVLSIRRRWKHVDAALFDVATSPSMRPVAPELAPARP